MNDNERFIPPLKTSGNIYHFKRKICLSCGFLIRGISSTHGRVCRDNTEIVKRHKHPRSQCQITHDREIGKRCREKYIAEGKKRETQCFAKNKPLHVGKPGKRLCLRCGNKFQSFSIHNRICERCSRINEGIGLDDLGELSKKIDKNYRELGLTLRFVDA